MYLYYDARYQARQMGAFVLVVISAAVGLSCGTPSTVRRMKSSR